MSERRTVSIDWFTGYIPVAADVYGPFAIHKQMTVVEGVKPCVDREHWTLTHVPTGYAVANWLSSREVADRIRRSLSCPPFSYAFWRSVTRRTDFRCGIKKRNAGVAQQRIQRIKRGAR